jgi:hypothetical protein
MDPMPAQKTAFQLAEARGRMNTGEVSRAIDIRFNSY